MLYDGNDDDDDEGAHDEEDDDTDDNAADDDDTDKVGGRAKLDIAIYLIGKPTPTTLTAS